MSLYLDHIPGFSKPGEFEALAGYARQCQGPWVEIGSYCGRSAVALGLAAREEGVTVFAVDPHHGNPEMAAGQDCHHPEVWAQEFGSLSVLIGTVRAHDLDGVVIPVIGPGEKFADTGISPGFVFIDGSHAYEDVKQDYATWSGLLRHGGLICLHDADSQAPLRVRDDAVAAGAELVDQVETLAVLRP